MAPSKMALSTLGLTEKPAAAVAPTGVMPEPAGITGRRWFSTGISAGVIPIAGAAATAAGSRVPSCLPPETKPIIETAGAAGGGGGDAPVGGKTLTAAGGVGATPDARSLGACGSTPVNASGDTASETGIANKSKTKKPLSFVV